MLVDFIDDVDMGDTVDEFPLNSEDCVCMRSRVNGKFHWSVWVEVDSLNMFFTVKLLEY